MIQTIPIEGATFTDVRGKMKFFNNFNMKEVVRFYEISPTSTEIIRGWQGHKKEKKWFYCPTGAFVINIVNISDNKVPGSKISPERIVLDAGTPLILEVPQGNATGFKALREGSKLIVFSNFTLEESKNDDFRYPLETWNVQW